VGRTVAQNAEVVLEYLVERGFLEAAPQEAAR
jgi:hypothetical protein